MTESGPEAKRPVVFAGENPLLTLYRPGNDEVIAAASYWRCSYSEQGEGNVLVIWIDPTASGLAEVAPRGIYTDNVALGRMVWTNFNQHFRPFQNRGIAELEPRAARFVQQADGRRLHRVTCSTGVTTIELLWRDALDVFQMAATATVGGQSYEVTNMVLPCAQASITVDGLLVPGEVRQPQGRYRSSAFIAFCETWVER